MTIFDKMYLETYSTQNLLRLFITVRSFKI